jgi:crotonobetainyl-CoA:carnitine CoA-transferase CaiB-like acyl-CoA transferase
MGAEVFKIESPAGDPQYKTTPLINGVSALYQHFNLNTKNIILDLKSDTDREHAYRLVATCDVFLNNMTFGVAEKLGLGYEVVRKINPRIIYCWFAGWGNKGPMASAPAMDPAIQAVSGFPSQNGIEGGPAQFMRYMGQFDLNTATHAAAAVLEALYARDKTGVGQSVDMSMLAAGISMQTVRLAEYFARGENPPRLGSAATTTAPHQAFQCLDRKYLALGIIEDGQWLRLCEALEAPELAADERFLTNEGRVSHRRELIPRLEAIFGSKPTFWWTTILSKYKVPHSRFWDFDEMRYQPQVLENQDLMQLDTGVCGVVTVGGPLWKFSRTPVEVKRAGSPGEHTQQVLASLSPGHPTAPDGDGAPAQPGKPALAGLKVLELAEGISGPYCGQLMGDGGADVIKVEPTRGDYARKWGPPFQGTDGVAFVALNRNKRSIVLDPASDDGKARLFQLARWADVVIADFRGPNGEPAPVSHNEARELNPNVIYTSISAFGEKGPAAEQLGAELVFQAQSYIWGGLGETGGAPLRLGADKASTNAGMFAFQGTLGALHWRNQTGEGQKVEISQSGSFISVNGFHWTCRSHPDAFYGSTGNHNVWTEKPNYGYKTKDVPLYTMVYPGREEAVKKIRTELGVPEEADGDMSTWGLERFTAAEVGEVFGRNGLGAYPFNTYETLLTFPQTPYLEMFREIQHPQAGKVTVIANPWRFPLTPEVIERRPPPALGQHTSEIEHELTGKAATAAR